MAHLTGIDVSQHQSDVDFAKVRKAGHDFAIVKCSEGQDFKDPAYSTARVRAIRKAGLKLGVYHYLRPRPGRTGDVEADFAVKTARLGGWGKPGDLPLVVDIEETALASPKQTAAYLAEFVHRVTGLTGSAPIIYSFPAFLQHLGLAGTFGCKLWIANFDVPKPTIPAPWHSYAIWQHTSHGTCPGVVGHVDLNVCDRLAAIPDSKPKPPSKRKPTRRERTARRARRAKRRFLDTHTDRALRVWLVSKARLGRWDDRYCLHFGVDPNVSPDCKRFITRAFARGLVATSTTGGQHAAGSFHFQRDAQGRGRGADVGNRRELVGTAEGMRRMQAHQRHEFAIRNRTRPAELLGPTNSQCILRGQPTTLGEGTALEDMHDTHVHFGK